MRVALVLPADLDAPTGGNRYDAALAEALEGRGAAVERRPVAGDWPVGTAAQRADLAVALRGGRVLADGLLACGAPDAVEGSGAAVLVHLPLALETGLGPERAAELDALERRSLKAASTVIATSRWAAAELRRRHGLADVAVAVPGTDAAPPAAGSDPPQLLQLASVTPRKDQLGVVEALARLTDLPWTAVLAGSLDTDPGYATAVRSAVTRHGLGERVRLPGPLTGAALRNLWDATDLVLLPSRAETWGMAVTEALARGVPAVVGSGTGAEEALGRTRDGTLPGAGVPPGDPAALAAAIRNLLGPGRTCARAAAAARRDELPEWPDTARAVLAALT